MKATITGIDTLSKRILVDLESGLKVSDIPTIYPVSLDQAKRLSRYLKILKEAEENLSSSVYEKVQLIGLKVLPLAKVFKARDWEGLTEILSVVTDDTKRDELELMIKGLEEKRKRIREFKEEASYKMEMLESRKRRFREKEKQLQKLREELQKEILFLKRYSESVREFLLEHVGLYKGKQVLAKRLDVNWQRSLRKKGIISYATLDYVFYINNLDELVVSYEKRLKQGRKCLWDYDIDIEKMRGDVHYIPEDGHYQLPAGLAVDLRSAQSKIEEDMVEIKKEQKTIEIELQRLKKTTVRTYMESVEATNTLSVRELKKHGELQDLAMKWFYRRGYVATAEFTLPNNRRCDVFAYNESGQIVIVEVKVSIDDLFQDKKWRDYLNYCDEFYFLFPETLSSVLDGVDKECGQLVEKGKGIELKREDLLSHLSDINREELIFTAARAIMKKVVYGY